MEETIELEFIPASVENNDDIDLDCVICDNKFKLANLIYNLNVYGQIMKCNIKEQIENTSDSISDGLFSFKLHPKCLITSMTIKSKTKKYKLKVVDKNENDDNNLNVQLEGQNVVMKTKERNKNEYKFKIGEIKKDDKIEIEVECFGVLNHGEKGNVVNIPKITNELGLNEIDIKGLFEHINGMKEVKINVNRNIFNQLNERWND